MYYESLSSSSLIPMKKKLLITVGAGASLDFGLPSVSAIDTFFDCCASKSHPLAKDPNSNLYRHCRDAINAYYGGAPRSGLRKWVNFEEVLYQLNLLVPYLSDLDRLQGTNALLTANTLPEVLHFGRDRRAVDGAVLGNLTSTLMNELVNHFIDACDAASMAKATEIAKLRQFLAALQDEFEIGIITLNYDNLFTQAMSGLHTGFDAKGNFDPMSVLTRTDWNFIYHLHGSVHFAMTGGTHNMHGITWVTTPSKGHVVHATGRNSQDSMEGTTYPMSPFVAGYGKTQQLLRQPFRTYFAQINRLVHEADSLLFLGYGFGDLHLNAVFSEVRNRHCPIVLVDWADDTQDPLPFRHDTWSYNLFKTLPGDARSMSSAGHTTPAYLGDLRAARDLEVSNNPAYPLAVWYNGMIEACQHPQKILKHLR
ncbi:SIR2 family protein (plasmid) [Chromobacterium amazonense]|uniref:SIR2 family protein n=2 Tax=Chromobacterium amazonense TaxID=1382803 RepID=UPI00237D6D38|nr:SIR2 family protein [Chromobacterium amazonense]MDE1712021.1 SIR2 family protein [Chromobacterium amazonense]